jgi:hypothetical protein
MLSIICFSGTPGVIVCGGSEPPSATPWTRIGARLLDRYYALYVILEERFDGPELIQKCAVHALCTQYNLGELPGCC